MTDRLDISMESCGSDAGDCTIVMQDPSINQSELNDAENDGGDCTLIMNDYFESFPKLSHRVQVSFGIWMVLLPFLNPNE